jgi:hypothetical protein
MGVEGRITEYPEVELNLKTQPMDYLPELHAWV